MFILSDSKGITTKNFASSTGYISFALGFRYTPADFCLIILLIEIRYFFKVYLTHIQEIFHMLRHRLVVVSQQKNGSRQKVLFLASSSLFVVLRTITNCSELVLLTCWGIPPSRRVDFFRIFCLLQSKTSFTTHVLWFMPLCATSCTVGWS